MLLALLKGAGEGSSDAIGLNTGSLVGIVIIVVVLVLIVIAIAAAIFIFAHKKYHKQQYTVSADQE